MKPRRLLVIICAGIALFVAVGIGVSAYWEHWEHKQTPFQNGPQLITALQGFAHDQVVAGRQLPSEVSLDVLLRGGYLTTNDVKAFEGLDLTFYPQAVDTNPQMILMRARTPDGQFVCALADGSVQQFSRSRYQEMLRNSGQQDSAANQSGPVTSVTNSTSAAAGSGR